MTNTSLISSIQNAFDIYNINPSLNSIDSLLKYHCLVCDWNSRMNLVSAKDLVRFTEYHLIDSLKPALVHKFSPNQHILDFGSGAGLPGIPLASVFPSHFSLLDSRLKRTEFLNNVISTIPLSNCNVIRDRVENLDSSFNNSFDSVITRATVKLPVFYSLCSRLIKKGGCLVSIKGDDISSELKSLSDVLNNHLFHITSTTPPFINGVRTGTIVSIFKR